MANDKNKDSMSGSSRRGSNQTSSKPNEGFSDGNRDKSTRSGSGGGTGYGDENLSDLENNRSPDSGSSGSSGSGKNPGSGGAR